MFVHGPGGWCEFICETCTGTPPDPGTKVVRDPVALDHLVDFDMVNASLGEAAQLVAKVAYAEIFVPANSIDERRDMRLESVPLGTVVQELGLMAVEPAS
jgi:hypothetical protein